MFQKKKQYVLEKEKEDKTKEDEVQLIEPIAQTNKKAIVQAMSQVSLKDLEIVGMKSHKKIWLMQF